MSLVRPLLLLILLSSLLPCSATAAAKRPNILLLVADDLGYGELGCQGNREIPTPNIDSLAKHGIRFTRGYVTASFCAPSRAALLAGRYQQRFGYENNPIGRQNLDPAIGLPLTERTLADRLKAAGYATGMVGKWHLGGTERFHPQRRGFDEFFGFLHEGHTFIAPGSEGTRSFFRTNALANGSRLAAGNITWSTHTKGNEPPYDAENPLLRGTRAVTEPEYLTDAFTREAVAFIEKNRARPWFLYLPYNAVHSPMQATARDLARFPQIADEHRRVFAAMLAALDDSVGAVTAKLRELKLEDDTLIFFLSDNGGPTQELTSQNTPLAGGKGTLLEGGVRVPFIMQWKSGLPRGVTSDLVVSSMDILPTALAAAGALSGPASSDSDTGGSARTGTSRLDGVDLTPFLTGITPGPAHESLFWRMGAQAALVRGQWKLLRARGAKAWQLFDLQADLAETHDLATAQPELVRELATSYEHWNAQMIPPLWTTSPPKGK